MYEELRDWYVSYCHDEYDSDEDESEATFDYAYATGEELGILYSTFDDDDGEEHDLQVSVILNPATELIYVDNRLEVEVRHDSINDLFSAYDGCDFNTIYSWAVSEVRV